MSVDRSCIEESSFQICSPSKYLQMFTQDPEERALDTYI